MKQILLLVSISLSIHCFSQDSTKASKSKYEEFITRNGIMVKSEYLDGGSIKDYSIEVTKATDLSTSNFILALKIQLNKSMFLMGSYKESLFYIDWDEVPSFIDALKFELPLLDTKPANKTIYTYSTRNGVRATCLFQTKAENYYPAGWTILLEGNEIKKKDLPDMITLLENCMNKTF
jgi:hypothetical protein